MQRGPIRAIAWAAAGQLALLALTGVYLYFEYRPSNDLFDLSDADRAVKIERVVRIFHRIDAWMLVLTLLALAILLLVEGRHRVETVLIASGSLVASYSGSQLPWDQLALWAVVVGRDLKGLRAAWGDQSRFVLIGGAELSPSTLQHWFWLHVVVAVLTLAGVVHLLAARRLARRDA